MSESRDTPRGKYIVIEGADGTGKSTQVELVRKRLKTEYGIESVEFHEPGGTPMADQIRTVIKNGDLQRHPETDLLLFTAARREIWQEADAGLKKGIWVVAARSVVSTLAYQGYGDGVNQKLILDTTRQFLGIEYLHPSLCVVLTLDNEAARNERIIARAAEGQEKDTFETKDDGFQTRMKEGYLSVAADLNLPVIPADGTLEAVNGLIFDQLRLSKLV